MCKMSSRSFSPLLVLSSLLCEALKDGAEGGGGFAAGRCDQPTADLCAVSSRDDWLGLSLAQRAVLLSGWGSGEIVPFNKG